MLKTRLIPSLVLRDGMIVQSVNFRHTNVIRTAEQAVDFFNRWSVDEIVLLDVSPTRARRPRFYEIVQGLSRKCFVPLTVGGWVTTVEEFRRLLRCGADKVAINTQAVRTRDFITECATIFGSQATVVSIDVRGATPADHEVYIDRGREPTGLAPVDWAVEAERRQAGEIFLTSIDHDGSRKGYDLPLVRSVADAVEIPVIAFGGVQTWQHLVEGVLEGHADAVCAANAFHYTEHTTIKAKQHMRAAGLNVR